MAFYDPSRGFVEEPELDAQASALARKQKLMQALQAQGPQISGRHGLAQALMHIGTAYLDKGTSDRYAQEEAQIEAQRNAVRQQNLGAYMDMREGRAGGTLNDMQAAELMQNNDPTAVNALPEPVKANPREAIVRAMASRDPTLQAIGQADFAQLGKRGAKDYEDREVGGKVVRTYADGRTQILGDFSKPEGKWEQTTIKGADGREIAAQKNTVTGEVRAIDKAPVVNVKNHVNTGGEVETEASKATGKMLPTKIEEASARGEKALNAIDTAERITALLQDPDVITGFGADQLAGIAAIGAKLGAVGPDAAAKTQELVNQLSQRVLEEQQLLKGPTSDKDILFLRDAAAGKITYTKQALERIAGISKALSFNEYMRANKLYKSAASIPGGAAPASMIPFPELSGVVLDEKLFDQTNPERVRYIGGGAAVPTPRPGTGAKGPEAGRTRKAPVVKNWGE